MDQQSIKIIPYDPSYLDEQIQIRDDLLDNLPFRTKELMAEKSDLAIMYGSQAFQSCNRMYLALEDDELVGYAKYKIPHSILEFLPVSGLEEGDVEIEYPMVKEGHQEALGALLSRMRDDLIEQGYSNVKCEISSGHQYVKEITSKYFDLEKVNMRTLDLEINDDSSFNLPDPVHIREFTEEDREVVTQKIISTGMPEMYAQRFINDIFEDFDTAISLVKMSQDGSEIMGWIGITPYETKPEKGSLVFVYGEEEEYVETAMELLHAALEKMKSHPTMKKLHIPPLMRPLAFDKLEELGFEVDVKLATYTLSQ